MENGREQEAARHSWGSSSRKDMGFEIFREGIFRGCRPVSYTHLDVYKRQDKTL